MENTKHFSHQYKKDANPIKKIDLHNNARLIMATFLDTVTIQQKFSKISKLNIFMTIPELYHLIKEYEGMFDRAYSEQMRYYIIASLWDQGFVKVGHAGDWQQLIQTEQDAHRKRVDESWLGQLGQYNKQVLNHHIRSLSSQVSRPKANYDKKKNLQLNSELALAIQQAEQQYYRESLTLKYLFQHEQEQQLDQVQQITLIFNKLDPGQLGSAQYSTLVRQFAINSQTKAKYSLFNAYKFGNNLHIYDRHTNIVTNPNSQIDRQDPGGLMLKIENIMEVFNRVSANQSQIKDKTSSYTYQAISHILTQYTRMREKIVGDLYARQANELNNRNEQVGLMARLQHIRQAAYSIVHHGKNQDMMNLRGLGEINLDESQPEQQTYRNKPTNAVDNATTFRNPANEHDFAEWHKTAEKSQKPMKIDISNEGYQSTAPNTKKQSVLTNKQIKNHYKRDNKQIASINNKSVSPQIHAFTASQQGFQSGMRSAKAQAKYDQLLRTRIYEEMQIVRLQKIKNRIRYYDVMYPYE